MNAKELIEKLKTLPQDIPIWLGVDSGEGYAPLEPDEVFAVNSIDASLDGDDVSDEYSYIKRTEYTPQEGDIVEELRDDEICVYRPIIILGDYGCQEDCNNAKYRRLNKKEIEQKYYEEQIKAHEEKIKELKKNLQ